MIIHPKDSQTIRENLHRMLPFKAQMRNFERFLDAKELDAGPRVIFGLLTNDTVKTLLSYKKYKNIKNKGVSCIVLVDTSYPIMKRYCKNYGIPEINPYTEIECSVSPSDILDQLRSVDEFSWDLYLEFDSKSDVTKFKLTA